MLAKIAGSVLATLLGLAPAGASARAPAVGLQVVPAGRIAGLAERIARSQVSDPNRAVVAAFGIADQSVPAGSVQIVAGTPQVNPSYVGVPIRIDVDGHAARTLYAGFRVTAYVQMPVAAHDLAPGDILSADDLGYARVPFSGRPSLAIDVFIGRKLQTTVAKGDLLSLEATAINELVRAGMPAVLIVHDGPVALAADVVARSSGGLGEFVTIFNPQTQRTLSGVVTGPNTVELTLPGAN